MSKSFFTDACFPDCGVPSAWFTSDFDLKYKILWGKTKDHGELILFIKEKKVQNKNLHSCIIIPTQCNIRLTHLGVEGDTVNCSSSRLSKYSTGSKQKWPVKGRLFGCLI